MAELAVGYVVDGRYEVEALIGRGGMGSVYRARHVITNGRVALKTLSDTMDPDAGRRFLAEAQAAATIGHPAIVAVSDANRTPEGLQYLVMELLAGKPLRLAAHGTSLPGDQIRRIGLELLDALAAAHLRGVVHRDLKPENIFLLAGTGAVKVLDFGIAKVLGTGFTSHGRTLGTIEYMAPEQLQDSAQVDGRADLWAVGVILYELVAGVRPYGGATREERYRALATEEPMPIEEVVPVGPDVAAFFATALARDPARRFPTAQAMAAALRPLALSAQGGPGVGGAGPTLGTGGAPNRAGPTLGTGVPDQVGPTLGTGPAWNPPPAPAPLPAPMAPEPARSSTKAKLAVGLGVVASGAIAFGVVMATRGSKSESTPPADAAQVARGDASAPPDAAVVIVPVPPPPVAQGSCEDHCKRLDKCGLRLSSCVADCAEASHRLCLDHAKDCTALAQCYWSRRYCDGRIVGGGSMSCLDAIKCISDYERQPNVLVCDTCVSKFSPSTALRYARVKVCVENAVFGANKALVETGKHPGNLASRCDELQVACVK